jgi:hypothetical protein
MKDNEVVAPVDSGPIVVTPGTAHVRITPIAYFSRAEEFLKAGNLLKQAEGRTTPVAAFLFCRTCELALKAYLLARGNRRSDVKRWIHDLDRLLVESYARGIDAVIVLSAQEKAILAQINQEYVAHELAYFEIASLAKSRVPSIEALGDIARRLVEAVRDGCYKASDGSWKPSFPDD